MEALIEATLADGILTDQEKTALINRAEKEGVDLNELEIYIQSILQKRQQELDKKSREARAQQEEADLESEKLRSKTLRECPKCGTSIPHLSNACPNCGFIIEKSELDEELSFLKSLLITCNQTLYCDDDGECRLNGLAESIIPQDQYEQHSKFFEVRSHDEDGYYVKINFPVVLSEASLYKNNEVIKESLNKLQIEEREVILQKCEEVLLKAKSKLSDGDINGYNGFSKNISRAKKILGKLKSDYSDFLSDEIKEINDKINELSKQSEELQLDPKFQKKMKKAEKSGCLILLLLVSTSALCFAFFCNIM